MSNNMRHIEILTEEPSAEIALYQILPKIIRSTEVTYKIITHQGKDDLLKKLPGKLRGYKKWMPENYRIVVLVDKDSQDCHRLKAELEKIAHQAGLVSKSRFSKHVFQVLNRIAIEELEAWFLGDEQAIIKAFPRVRPYSKKRKYNNPDSIPGGTWESLEKLLQNSGYYKEGMSKMEVSKKISEKMNPSINKSQSFNVFVKGIIDSLN